ncbi:MAG: UDP-N-acetylmuramate--L-alanine ligase [Chitinivibrionales bacterium]|nr:UDP-N-acetylmuramate--L-alanine ligase [Chitinivibrionales bacterium]MBD3356008.1 UDP-N-acetylmuramate--L-alanine ligase [Chitinivibrionales bacterium]
MRGRQYPRGRRRGYRSTRAGVSGEEGVMLGLRRHIHFVGIGGAGMSPLAELVRGMGHHVTGSDERCGAATRKLESLGIAVQYGHTPDLCRDADLLVYSSAVRIANPERAFAARRGIPTIRRAELLGDLMRSFQSIGVAGTHGKTTTSSMIAHILHTAGRNPSAIIGGSPVGTEAPPPRPVGSLLVVEADEYDRSFLSMYPTLAVVTNIDTDHLDCYRDLDDIKGAFVQYAESVPFYGAVFACIDDPGVRDIAANIHAVMITYGTDDGATYRIAEVNHGRDKTRFEVFQNKERFGEFEIPMAGMHNVRNAAAAVAVAAATGIDPATTGGALARFPGVKRRFEFRGEARGVRIYDDYAHHPREIAATLDDAAYRGFGRIIAIFQPHLYSRTRSFLEEFANSLAHADMVIVTGIYRSREDVDHTVNAAEIVGRIRETGHTNAHFIEDKSTVVDWLAPHLRSGDAVLIMGAGDIDELGSPLLERIADG